MAGDLEGAKKHGTEDGDNKKKPDKAESFAHDGKNGIVDRFWKIAGGLNGITNANTRKTTGTDGEHGVFDMISGVGRFGTSEGGNPGVYALHPVRGGSNCTDRDDDGSDENDEILF